MVATLLAGCAADGRDDAPLADDGSVGADARRVGPRDAAPPGDPSEEVADARPGAPDAEPPARDAEASDAALLALHAIEPARGPTSGGTLVTLHGGGFAPGARVRFGDVPVETERPDPVTLRARTPAGAPGPVDVEVENPAGQRASLPGAFTRLEPPPRQLVRLFDRLDESPKRRRGLRRDPRQRARDAGVGRGLSVVLRADEDGALSLVAAPVDEAGVTFTGAAAGRFGPTPRGP